MYINTEVWSVAVAAYLLEILYSRFPKEIMLNLSLKENNTYAFFFALESRTAITFILVL